MSSPRWPVVLFDMDGTVIDTIRLIIDSYVHALGTIGERAEEPLIRTWIGRTLADVFVERYPDHADALEATYLEWNLGNMGRLVRTYPGVPEFFDALDAAGVRFGIATAKRRTSAQATLDAVGLDGRVDLLATMGDTAEHKPSPQPLLFAASKLGIDPGDAVYVGDAIYDVRAAKAAGMASIAVSWGAGVRDDLSNEGPTAIVDTVDALRALALGAD